MPYIVKSSLDIGGKIIPWNEREAETLIKEKEQFFKEKEEREEKEEKEEKEERAEKVEKVEEPKQEKQEKQEISRKTEVKVKNRKE